MLHTSTARSHSSPTDTSPTLRGKYLRERVLCQAVLAPPDDIDLNLDRDEDEPPTLRERLELHRTNPVCAGCHAFIDPPGFLFENYDAVGRYRIEAHGYPVNATGNLDGTSLNDAVDLAELSAEVLGAPPFVGVFYWANGVPWHAGHGAEQASWPDIWTPSTTGAGYALSEMLLPFAGRRVSVISRLEPHTDIPSGPSGQGDGHMHMRGFMVALTGDSPQSDGFDHGSHTLTSRRGSIDQYVARYPGFDAEEPRLWSLEVGVSRARFHDYGHWNAISYNGTDSQNLPVHDAGSLYDRLFGVPVDDSENRRRARPPARTHAPTQNRVFGTGLRRPGETGERRRPN